MSADDPNDAAAPGDGPGAVLVADDHEVTRFGLGQLVRHALGATRVIEAERFETALEHLDEADLGLAIIDLGMPGLPGPEALTALRRARPEMKLVVLSGSTARGDILGCLAAGVHGYIVKTEGLDDMADRLRAVLRGQIYVPPLIAEIDGTGEDEPGASRPASPPPADVLARLSPRQRDVLESLEKGMTNKEIGRALGITDRTVKMHLATIYPMLGVHNRTKAAAVLRDLREATGAGNSGD